MMLGSTVGTTADAARRSVAACLRHPWWSGAVAAVVAGLLVLVVVVVPGGQGGHPAVAADTVQATDPPSPEPDTASPTPTPTAEPSTAAPTPSDVTPTSDPPSTAAAAPEVPFTTARLLPTSYAQATFGRGLQPAVGEGHDGFGPRNICFGSRQLPDAPGKDQGWLGRLLLYRGWNWPGESTAVEAVHRSASEADAAADLHYCSQTSSFDDEGAPKPDVSDRTSDGGYVQRASEPLFTVFTGEQQVGRDVVVVTWRASGGMTSLATVTRLLHAAVAKWSTDDTEMAQEAPAPVEPVGFDGIPTLSQIPVNWTATEVDWVGDVVDSEGKGGTPCPEGGLRLDSDGWVARGWGTYEGGAEDNEGLSLSRGHAPDESTAARQFQACREAMRQTGEGVGDDSFVDFVESGWWVLYVRVGTTYWVFNLTGHSEAEVTAVAKAVIANAGG
jgi:hypothetical protein